MFSNSLKKDITKYILISGSNCEKDIDECVLNYTQLVKYNLALGSMSKTQIGPCVNTKSRCINTVGSFICKCSRESEGEQCEITTNNCDNNPCRNGASCDNLPDGFRCRCAVGFTGDICEVSDGHSIIPLSINICT